MGIFNSIYFGNTFFSWGYALAIVVLFILISKFSLYLSKTFLAKLTVKTKSDFNDVLIDLTHAPFAFLIIVIGFVVAFQFLTFDVAVNNYFYNAIKLLLLVDVVWFALKFTDSFFERILKPIIAKTKTDFDDQLIPWLKKSSKIIIVFLGVIIILDTMGIDVMALLAGVGIGGIAFAFAAQKTIADAFGGLSILFSKPFKVGDVIKFSNGAYTGTVEEISLRHTRIRDLDKQLVVVPNSILSSEVLTNISNASKKKVVWTIGLAYDTPNRKIELAKKIIESAIKGCEYCDDDYVVAFQDFGESAINIMVVFFTKKGIWKDMVNARDEIGMKIKKEFEKAKIEIAYPTQTIHLSK